MSGWDGNHQHVVKVVGQAGLEVEKAALTKIESLHVYSVQSMSLKSVASLSDVDLGQNREFLGAGVGSQHSLLGRIVLCNPPMRGKVDAPPRLLPKPSDTLQAMAKDKTTNKKNDKEVESLNRKRRLVTSDSDEEDVADANAPASEEQKFRTFINDKGEEVTEMIETKESDAQKNKKTNAQNNKPKPAAKIKQKGIAAFFTKKV